MSLDPIWNQGSAGYLWAALTTAGLGTLVGLLVRSRMVLAINTEDFLRRAEKLLRKGDLERAYSLSQAYEGPVAGLTGDALWPGDEGPRDRARLPSQWHLPPPELVRRRIERNLNSRLAPALWGQWTARGLLLGALLASTVLALEVGAPAYPALGLAYGALVLALYLSRVEERRWVRDLRLVLSRLPEAVAQGSRSPSAKVDETGRR